MVNMRHHMPQSSGGQLSFVEAEEALKMSPSRDVRLKLSEENCRALENTNAPKSSSQCAADSRHHGHKHWFS